MNQESVDACPTSDAVTTVALTIIVSNLDRVAILRGSCGPRYDLTYAYVLIR